MRATKIVTGVGAAAAAQWGAARLLTVMTQRAAALEAPAVPAQRTSRDGTLGRAAR